MNWLKLTLWTYFIFVLHFTVAARLAIAGFAPHFMLAGLSLLAWRATSRQALLTGALWGLLADCLTDGRLGAGLICFLLSTWVLQRCTVQSNRGPSWKLAIFSVPVIFAAIVGTAGLRMLFDIRPVDWQALCIDAAGSAVFTGILIVIIEIAISVVRGRTSEHSAIAAPTVSNKWRMLTD
jgi:rod shape-determining protein MreD